MDSIFIDGVINGKTHTTLLDTGSTRTIVKSGLISGKLVSTSTRLKAATGESAKLYGEVMVTFKIGRKSFKHNVLVDGIAEDVILGMDIMSKHGVLGLEGNSSANRE